MFLNRVRSSSKHLVRHLVKQLSKQKNLVANPRFIHSSNVIWKNNSGDIVKLNICGESLRFPSVWLRDNCQCSQCYHPSARSRTIDFSTFNLNVKTQHIVHTEKSIKIFWDDGHESEYQVDWLKYRSFLPEQQKSYTETIYKPPKIHWHGDDFQKICSHHNYNEILNSDKALYEWLHKLSVYGVALIENAPDSETALDSITAKVAFPRQTHYGVKFVVQHVANTSNVAYLSNNLQVHTDLPYYKYCPGVNMLHCLVQTENRGGENLLSDCHYVADHMKEHYPTQYKLLTQTEVEWKDVGTEFGNDFYKLHREPVICLNKYNNITRINFSIPQRGSHFPGAIEDVRPWYEAHSLFMELNMKFSAKFKTSPGNILVFDNIRLLHGRNGYEDSSKNVRKLIGAYVDWDEIYSRLRCLKVKLNKDLECLI